MNQLFDLSGKVAVVTGAAGLLGGQHVATLAQAGAQVVATDLSAPGLERLVTDSAPTGLAPVLTVVADISEPDSVDSLREQILARLGRVDVLVNNAAVDDKFESPALAAEQSRFEVYPLELWERSWRVNVTGTFLCCQRLGAIMVAQGGGSIINIASTYGIVAPQQELYRTPSGEQAFYKGAAYPTTKGAILAFTRFLASYWGSQRVRVNALSPGGVLHGQADWFQEAYAERTMLGRMASPTDYRGALLFLASEASAYMTGANLVVDGGWTAW